MDLPRPFANRLHAGHDGAGSLGRLLDRAYAGAWRPEPPPLDLTLEQLARLLPHLAAMGGVGVVWPRLRERADEYGAAGMALEFAYQAQRRHNSEHPAHVAQAVSVLQAAGIDPVLLKGYTLSRRYPKPAVRLSGDIDLVVHPAEFDRAAALIAEEVRDGQRLDVDLHHDGMWVDMPRPTFREEVLTEGIAGVTVRVLNPEDQLHVLCHHFIRHAALRPLWLCDIALAIETRPPQFDWNRALGDDPRRAGWVLTAIGLAHRLIGARIDDTPIAGGARQLPAWLIPAVHRRWELGERPPPDVFHDIERRGLGGMLRRRWPEPIAATVYLHAPFNEIPRLPLQWAAYLRRMAVFGTHRLPHQGGTYLRRWRVRHQLS